MEPIDFNDIPDEVFIEDIMDLTADVSDEFPEWLQAIEQKIGTKPEHIRFTDFVENTDDDNSPIEFAGYFYDVSTRKMYAYTVENKAFDCKEVDVNSLSVKDSFSVKVLHLLK